MRGLNGVTERGASLSTHSQACLPPSGFCFSPCSPVPEIPLDSFHSKCISPPSLTLPPAHLLGFDLHDLNDHKEMTKGNFWFFKGFSPAKQAKVMPTAQILPRKMLPTGRREKGEQEALIHQFVTSSLILSWHSLTSDKCTPSCLS